MIVFAAFLDPFRLHGHLAAHQHLAQAEGDTRQAQGRVFGTLDSINGALAPLSFAVGGVIIDLLNKNLFILFFVIFAVYTVLAVVFVLSGRSGISTSIQTPVSTAEMIDA